MANCYILATHSPDFSVFPSNTTQSKLPLKELATVGQATPVVGDKILVTLAVNGRYETLQPYVATISVIEKGNASLDLDAYYSEKVPLDKVRSIMNRSLSDGSNPISQEEFKTIIGLLGAQRPTEKQLLDLIRDYVSARGYYFSDETIYNYHICLKTRPFVILAGLSGTGKSKLSQLYAEALGHTVQNGRYLRLAVRPSWNDDRFLLGYLNSITGEYVTEPAIDFIIQAEKERDNLYFFCLDEMNLAHVEYYFSQFLSALEEENSADRKIPLYSRSTQERLASQQKPIDLEREVIIPPNVLFTGTINVDETTQPLSDKVIDRANTLEFFQVELDKIPERRPVPQVSAISSSAWHSYVVHRPDTAFRSQIIEIGNILNRSGLGLGYRVLREIELYLANSHGLLQPAVAFDLQVKQRILPRVRGTLTIRDTLRQLTAYLKQHGLSRSVERLEEMESRLTRDGYTSFWR